MMKLSDILGGLDVVTAVKGSTDICISSLTNDSRKAVPGCLFVAVNGCGADGRAYIRAAVEAGACAVMAQECEELREADAVTTITVSDSRRAVALCADIFYGHPSGRLKLAGITGTNGKTTTVTLLY